MPPDIKVIKLKIRRGTDADRKLIKLDEGELGFTTDTQRVFVGDGVLSGGIVVGNKIYTSYVTNTYNALSTINAQVGDIVPLSGVSYQLINTDYTQLSNWSLFSPSLNTTYLKYSNNQTGILTLVPASIDSTVLNTQTLSSTTVNFNSNKVNVNYDPLIFEGTTNLSILPSGLSARHISSKTLGKGLSGGDGIPFGVDVDGVTIDFVGNKLQVISSPVTALRVDNLKRGFSTTYTLTGINISTIIAGANTQQFTVSADGTLNLIAPPLTASSSEIDLPSIIANNGYIAQIASSIYDMLSVDSDSSVMSAYNGVPNQRGIGGWNGTYPNTTITAFSANGPITLTSAGFVVFRGKNPTRRDGKVPDSFAIPVFSLPFDIP